MAQIQTVSSADIFPGTTASAKKCEVSDNNGLQYGSEKMDLEKQDPAFNTVLGGMLSPSQLEFADKMDQEGWGQDLEFDEQENEPELTIAELATGIAALNPVVVEKTEINTSVDPMDLLTASMEDAERLQDNLELSMVKNAETLGADAALTYISQQPVDPSLQDSFQNTLIATATLTMTEPTTDPNMTQDLLELWQTTDKQALNAGTKDVVQAEQLDIEATFGSESPSTVKNIENPTILKHVMAANIADEATASGASATDSTTSAQALVQALDQQQIPAEVVQEVEEPRQDKAADRFVKRNISTLDEYGRGMGIQGGAKLPEQLQAETSTSSSNIEIFQALGPIHYEVIERSGLAKSSLLADAGSLFNSVTPEELFSSLNMNSPDWQNGLGSKMLWMLDGKMQRLSINIEPPELGPLSIQLRVMDNKANVTFTSHNSEVKGIIESATPRLQRIFDEQGFGLGEVNVNISTNHFNGNAREFGQQPNSAHSTPRRSASSLVTANNTVDEPRRIISSSSLIDYYA